MCLIHHNATCDFLGSINHVNCKKLIWLHNKNKHNILPLLTFYKQVDGSLSKNQVLIS